MPKDFFDLPRELWVRILFNLDAISLAHCAMTCKPMYETFQSSSQLLYIIQLHLDGLKDAGTAMPYSERVQRLLRQREAWSSLMSSKKLRYSPLDVEPGYHQVWELVGGTFANRAKQHFGIVWLPTFGDGETPTRQRFSTGMQGSHHSAIAQLHSVYPKTVWPSVTENDLLWCKGPVMMICITIHTYANLKANVCSPSASSPTTTCNFRVHIRAMSTGAVHPLAHQSPLCLADPMHDNPYKRVRLHLAHNTLALSIRCVSLVEPWVHIWDWTTSHILANSSALFGPSPPLSRQEYAFGLLDSSHCFVTSAAEAGSIRLYQLVHTLSDASNAIHLATLHLPPTSPGTQICGMAAHAGPIEANPLPQMPFVMNDEDHLHVFEVAYLNKSCRGGSLNLFVHQRVFTKYCTQGTQNRHGLPVPLAQQYIRTGRAGAQRGE
ncbi:hypothetical protein BJ912DRAFT_1123820 [Pholiota molesta]|nr:hypothetical protein BJ912DRAFT_1123820 [Pholiota molesta]